MYQISVNFRNVVEVKELEVKKETARTVVVSDGFTRRTILKSCLPFNWRFSKTLITSDLEKGKVEWNEHFSKKIEECKKEIDTYNSFMFTEEVEDNEKETIES